MGTILEQIERALDDTSAQARVPALIQIGEAQARGIADELNQHIIILSAEEQEFHQSLGIPDPAPIKKIRWEEIMVPRDGEMVLLYGVRVEGVESPDYLNIVTKDQLDD